MIEILKFNQWLYRQPNYDGFAKHIKKLEEDGTSCSCLDLIHLAEQYNIKLPEFKDGKMVIEFKPKKSIKFVDLDFKISMEGVNPAGIGS